MAENDTIQWTPELRAEMEAMTSTQRAAVLMLLLGVKVEVCALG